MIKVQMQTFQVPRWLGPVLVLTALALIPFALMIGLALMAVVLGWTALRLFLSFPSRPIFQQGRDTGVVDRKSDNASPAIDAEYEVKDGHDGH